MCRRSSECTELGADPTRWNRECPLPRKDWFDRELDVFESAIATLITGHRTRCIELVSNIPTEAICEWYVEHGQMSGYHRVLLSKPPEPSRPDKAALDKLRSPSKFERQVFERDGYRCRYCGTRLVSKLILKEFTNTLAFAGFRKGPRNIDTHGVYILFEAVADHVVPWQLGGRTEPANLVSSCNPCNYGKSFYTVEQLGLENPFSRPPVVDEWNGLLAYLDPLKRIWSERRPTGRCS